METNSVFKKQPKPSSAATSAAAGSSSSGQGPGVMGPPPTGTTSNSDLFFFVNGAFRNEFDICARLTPNNLNEQNVVVTFEADLVEKLNSVDGESMMKTYSTILRIPKGCIVRAQVHPMFRRLLVQSIWLQQQPAMLRFRGSTSKEEEEEEEEKITAQSPIIWTCANPPCSKLAVRFVGNPGFFLHQKNCLLIDPLCIPVCNDTGCILQAQHMSATMHAKTTATTKEEEPSTSINPAIKMQMPNSVKNCNTCFAFEQKYGGTAVMLAPCPLCGLAYYCSKQCQIQDWQQRGHNKICTNAKGKTVINNAAAAFPETTTTTQPTTTTATITEEAEEETSESTKDPESDAAAAAVPSPAPAPFSKTTISQQQEQEQQVASSSSPGRTSASDIFRTRRFTKQQQQQKSPLVKTPTYEEMTELTQAMSAILLPTYNMLPAEVIEPSPPPIQRSVSAPPPGTAPTIVEKTIYYESPNFNHAKASSPAVVTAKDTINNEPVSTTAKEGGSPPTIKTGTKKAE